MTMAILHDIGVAAQIGTYSDGVETPQGARWLYTSGTPGLAADGTHRTTSRARLRSRGRTSSRCWSVPA
jgi:hypothetical protein